MKELWKNLKFAWTFAKSQKIRLILYLICNIFQVIISVIVPIISAQIIVKLTSNLLTQVISIAFILFLIEISRNVLNYLCRYFSQVTYRETFTAIQLELGKSILKLENKIIDKNSSGLFIQRLSTDTSKIADIFNIVNYYLLDIITNIGIFIAVFIINFKIGIYMLIMVLIIGIFESKRTTKMNEKDKEFRKENEQVSGFVGELVRGVRDIKMLSAEKSFLKELSSKLVHLNQTRYSMGQVNRNYSFLTGFLRDFFDFTTICLLVYFIFTKDLTIALALVLHNYQSRITYVVNSFSFLLEGIKDFNLSTSRIFSIIKGKEFTKEKFGTKHLDKVSGNFSFKKVTFSYDEHQEVLKDLSFNVKANTTVAFVGKSGAGKTTIFNLLCKMYDLDKGDILIDGESIKELDKESIRNNITVISQNPYIFNLSIKDNLRLVKDDLTEEDMKYACKMACLDTFIENLPDKYDTIVGEGGISLSGGQRQRLAIARALVQKTKIILFDEATSALDNETQNSIREAIENMRKDYTILIIAHRLSTIINCHHILFLEDGQIKAEGTHEELLKTCKEYKKLYNAEIEK